MPRLQNLQGVLSHLETYCRIRSGSSNIEGVEEAQDFLKKLLAPLGFLSRRIANPDKRASASLLVASKFVSPAAPTLTFVSHADTLDGADLDSAHAPFSLSAERITGQGVLDDKASQFVALWGLSLFTAAHPEAKLNLNFVSSPNEELGSFGFYDEFRKLSLESQFVLGFEPALNGKDLVTERRGNRWYDIHITGREAHAGRAHRHGINAAHELAIKIAKIHKLTSYKRDVTVNIGQIETTSSTYNVVCGGAQAKLDTRFATTQDRDTLHKRITQILKREYVHSKEDKNPCTTRFEITDDCPPLHSNRSSRKWATSYAKIISELESRPIESGTSGGGADVCYFNRPGLIVFDGLGACGGSMHRADEYVEIAWFETRARALANFLAEVLKP